jgi:hypothetical protein
VKEMILASFIFWQQLDISPDGEKFIKYYKVSKSMFFHKTLLTFFVVGRRFPSYFHHRPFNWGGEVEERENKADGSDRKM